ncbi:MAG: GNAT family N-acetyltransferase [Clostridia bacterium]|nr:GNAT family N-acetyltransferase [Clostridia bacterium]
MIDFKKIELSHCEIYNSFLKNNNLLSCENPFVNLLVWQRAYENMIAVVDNCLLLRSGKEGERAYRLPKGENSEKVLKRIFESEKPDFWICEDEEIPQFIKQNYNFYESRDDFDYIYLREDLSYLSGKKYHSKRNHISAFSKKYKWKYASVSKNNIDDVKACAEKWYSQGEVDSHLEYEKEGINLILDNMERLGVIGGAIYVDGDVVAFTLGTPLNSEVFVTHIEKALPEFAESYTVINCEFAKNELSAYKYINREDDMGIEGIRKAKLSYKPNILLKKYYCTPISKAEKECREIYMQVFGDDEEFTNELFKNCFKYCKTLKADGEIVSMLFLMPCEVVSGNKVTDAYYIYGVATLPEYREKGYMRELIESVIKDINAPIFLRPVNSSLIKFYEKFGFSSLKAQNSIGGKVKLMPKDDFAKLSHLADKPDDSEFDFMSLGFETEEKINFMYSFN